MSIKTSKISYFHSVLWVEWEEESVIKNMVWRGGLQENFYGIRGLILDRVWEYFKKEVLDKKSLEKIQSEGLWPSKKLLTYLKPFKFLKTRPILIFFESYYQTNKDYFQNSYQIILILWEYFFQTVLQNKIFIEFIANHTDIFRQLLLNMVFVLLYYYRTWFTKYFKEQDAKSGYF